MEASNESVAAATRQVEEWNAKHPAGTPVTVTLDDRSQAVTRTRSAAWMLGADGNNAGRTPVVLVEGRAEALLLSRCRPRVRSSAQEALGEVFP